MKKYNKIELTGFILLVIGALCWISDEYYKVESLSTLYKIGQIIFWIGLLIWALGYMKREKQGKI